MKRFLPLLMLTGFLFGQDVLTLNNGQSFDGTFYGKVGEDIVFKVEGESNTKKYSINNVKTIVTKNGELHTFDISTKDDNQIGIEKPRFKQDVLLHKSGKNYKGRYITKENEVIIFRVEGEKDIRMFLINDVDIIITNKSGTTVELYYPFDIKTIIEEDKSEFWKRAAEIYLSGNGDEYLRQNAKPPTYRFYICALILVTILVVLDEGCFSC